MKIRPYTHNKMSVHSKMSTESARHAELQSHAAWHPDVSNAAVATERLKGQSPYTYLLRPAPEDDQHQYYFSFVGGNSGDVTHKFVNVVLEQGKWVFKNGSTVSGGPFVNLDEFVAAVMHCDCNRCMPLQHC